MPIRPGGIITRMYYTWICLSASATQLAVMMTRRVTSESGSTLFVVMVYS